MHIVRLWLRLSRLVVALLALGAMLAAPSGAMAAMSAPPMPCHAAETAVGMAMKGDMSAGHDAGAPLATTHDHAGMAGAGLPTGPGRAMLFLHLCCALGQLAMAPSDGAGLARPEARPLAFDAAASRLPAGWTLAIPEPPPRSV
ncbi:hypothetical protein NVS89_14940 [Ancylobacter sp. MQZ15Z-1]|uniref:DUF2946 domain-containing protein n=1 Tax=Ancylobacter mangrovi TaxID=2972472 RepID=A0A9X2PFF6_9HYPH|nr:hypothetical protein [Ancylobacter mangrovi]MCS0496399.1 hypothetical protein [Ancylobacter mangrovi]